MNGVRAGWWSRHADVVLAVLVVSIVGMMIVPLPTHLLDLLLSFNIAASVVLLLTAIYASDPLKIATFPTLLLVTTLFRLGLNVSSSRLILLQADAGEVIQSFGSFVVRGNLVVGVILFVILTVIQFVVIAKGAERVAEVGARFALDAMPGKQMAIDADLRAGTINHEEARRRRTALGRESQLYGAMDGAMKFVKGDVIAGIVITVVNIVGGLIVGIVQQGRSAADAAHVYSVLTIGDGLVTQIPALLVSTGAAFVVTRVASEDADGGHLGQEMGRQILAQPRAIGIAAGLLVVLALIPGMPTVPFLVLGAGAAFLARALSRKPASKVTAGVVPKKAADELTLGLPVVVVELAGDAEAFVADGVPEIRRAIYQELGVMVPGIRVRPGLERGWRLRLAEVPIAGGEGDVVSGVIAGLYGVAHELVGMQEVQALLDGLEKTHPALVREVMPRVCTLQLLTDVLRRLVEEKVSIRDLRAILGAVADWARAEKDPVLLTEYVRGSLKRQITHAATGGAGALEVYVVAPELEDAIRGAITRTQTGSFLALEPAVSKEILASVRTAIASRPDDAGPPVLLTAMDARRYLKKLVDVEHPRAVVLSFQELAPDVQVTPVGRISL